MSSVFSPGQRVVDVRHPDTVGIVAELGTWAVQRWDLAADADEGFVPVGGRTPPYDDMLAVWWQGRDWPEWVPEEMLRAAG